MASLRTSPMVVLALLVTFLLVCSSVASFSRMKVFKGPGCHGDVVDCDPCVCTDVHGMHGGFEFMFGGDAAAFVYAENNCQGQEMGKINKSVSSCHSFGWKSVLIPC